MTKIIYYTLLIFLGVSMFIYGGYDDSPGGQLLGFVAVIMGIRGLVKNLRSHT